MALLTWQTPIAIYCSSGTKNHKFHSTATPAALHSAPNTGFVKVFRHRSRQNSAVKRPAISAVSRWLCTMPVNPTARASQHQAAPFSAWV